MIKNRFLIVLGIIAIVLISLAISSFRGNDALSQREAAWNFAERHTDWTRSAISERDAAWALAAHRTDASVPATSKKELPLKGSVQASETHTGVPPTNHVDLTGSGNATQLGLYNYTYQAELYLPTLSATATATFVAADGSCLFTQGTGQGTLTNTPGVVSIVENLAITGGTGRFEGASGNITIQRLVDRATFSSSGTLEGMITLP
jgi:hypothetical protein